MCLNCGVGEDSESLLDSKEIQLINAKGNQSWIFIGRTDAQAETPILWPPDVKNWLIGKDPDAGKDWRQEEKGMTEDEMVGWYHWLDGLEFEQAPGVGDGQGGLVCCSPGGRKESDMSDWTELNWSTHHSVVHPRRLPSVYIFVHSCIYFCYIGYHFLFLLTSVITFSCFYFS